jgi:uncharacterized protein YdcH (DUF465 family)
MEHHPLIKEFPEHKEKIHELKVNNNHFRKLAFEYEGIDKANSATKHHSGEVSDQ